MLLIGLESSHSPHQCCFGLCFRCSSGQYTFCRVKPTNASFFSNLHALSPWSAPAPLASPLTSAFGALFRSSRQARRQFFAWREAFALLAWLRSDLAGRLLERFAVLLQVPGSRFTRPYRDFKSSFVIKAKMPGPERLKAGCEWLRKAARGTRHPRR